MKILILGASTESSIGCSLGKRLTEEGHTVVMVSRSGKLGLACDAIDHGSVDTIFRMVQPEAVIMAAGCFPQCEALGSIADWKNISSLLQAKSMGSLIILDAAVRHSVEKVVFMAGSQLSSDPAFSHWTVANGAVWAAVQFAAKHTKLEVHYVELGVVDGSTMGESYLSIQSEETSRKIRELAVTVDDILAKIELILKGAYSSGSRIPVNKQEV